MEHAVPGGLADDVADGQPALEPAVIELFFERVFQLSKNIREGVSLPAAYVEPPSARKHHLKLELRDASQSDTLDLMELYKEVFPLQAHNRNLRGFSYLLSELVGREIKGFCLVAQTSGRVAGMLVGRTLADPSDILLTHVGVRRRERKQGIASSLFETVIEIYSNASGIQTLTANASQDSETETYLLKRLGFQPRPTTIHKNRWIYTYPKMAACA